MAIKERTCIEFNEAAKCPTHSKTYRQKHATQNSHGGDTISPDDAMTTPLPRSSGSGKYDSTYNCL